MRSPFRSRTQSRWRASSKRPGGKTGRPRRPRHAAPRSGTASLRPGHGREHHARGSKPRLGDRALPTSRRGRKPAVSRRRRGSAADEKTRGPGRHRRGADSPRQSHRRRAERRSRRGDERTVSPTTQRPIMLGYVGMPYLEKKLFAVCEKCASGEHRAPALRPEALQEIGPLMAAAPHRDHGARPAQGRRVLHARLRDAQGRRDGLANARGVYLTDGTINVALPLQDRGSRGRARPRFRRRAPLRLSRRGR